MQKILMKRVWRDLKENIFRYVALALLIIMGMYVVVSMIAAADVIIEGTKDYAMEHKVESGEFTVFVPLTKEQEEEIREEGVSLERMFYLDFAVKGNKHLRVYKNRNDINLLEVEAGKMAGKSDEMTLEKRFCESNKIQVGDSIQVAGKSYKVAGRGVTPDYEGPFEQLSDPAVDSRQFGVAFVTDETYENLLHSEKSIKSEEYTYAYRLNGKMTNKELKEKLKDFTISQDSIDDKYFQEFWENTGAKKDELLDGVEDLADGASTLSDNMGKLKKYRKKLLSAAETLLDSSLQEATEGFASYGLSGTLTEENFEEKLYALKEKSGSSIVNLKINAVADQLKGLKKYKDAIDSYTDGVSKAAKGSKKLADGTEELQDSVSTIVDKYFDFELYNLKQFVEKADNPRIGAAGEDKKLNKYAGLVAGVVILILFAYVISVFVIHGIEKESSVIGALYALGVTKQDLLKHYLMLPVIITFLSSVIGLLLGISPIGARNQMTDSYGYFSMPELSVYCPGYLVIYGVVMPVVIAAFVNYFVIRKHLSRTVLSLMRNEGKKRKIRNVSLKGMRFVTRFQIRQMLKEMRTGFTVIFGLFISLLIVMLALDCLVMCNAFRDETAKDTKYKYMYIYKYPESEVPKGGTAYFAKEFKKEIRGYQFDIMMLGVKKDNPYFPAKVTDDKKKIVISSAFAQKNNLHIGDSLVLTDEEEDMDYAFRVQDIMQFSTGLYVFMDIDNMRELFGESDDYYNVVCSDHKLSIPSGRLQSTLTKSQVEKSSAVFSDMMMPMVIMLCVVSVVIFIVVMYLMIKVMIDRAAFDISLVRIFGYRMQEVRKLYLNGNFYMVAIGGILCMVLSKITIDALFPLLIINISTGMNLTFGWQMYAGVYLVILGLYQIINCFLVKKVKQIVPAEVLKNRE